MFPFLVFLTTATTVFAQETTGNFPPPLLPVSVYAAKALHPVVVDGKLTESDWSRARETTNFFRMEPRQGGPVKQKTSVKILFDEKNLYFGVFCKDSLGKKGVRVQDMRRDFAYGDNDIFYIQLDPQNLKRFCVSFQVTPLGTQKDLQVFDDQFKDNNWDALWKVRTSVTDSGYFAEFAIPFSSLRYTKPAKGEEVAWGLTLARLARRDFEVTVFPAVPQAYTAYRMTYAANLKGLALPAPSLNLRVQPYSLYQHTTVKNSTAGSYTEHHVKAGGEAKWAINPNAVLDLTLNTDFAQADVDQAVNNLTRFNVLFPEKRQFFLENNGIYAGADINDVKPFFSRTIGLANTAFNAASVPIDAGLRFTDRNQRRTLATLFVHQEGTRVQSAADFGVLRYIKNYGRQNNTGVMYTQRVDEQDGSLSLKQRINATLTVDGFIRPDNSSAIKYLVSVSRNNTSDSIGIAGGFFAGRNLKNWYYAWDTKFVDEKYLPGMGFVFANNTVHHNVGGYRIWRPANAKLIRRWDPGFFIDYYHNASDFGFQQGAINIFPVFIIFQNGSFAEATTTPTWEKVSNPIHILSAVIGNGHYFYARQSLEYSTDQSKKLSAGGTYRFGSYYNGSLRTMTGSLRVAPIPYIAFTGNYEKDDLQHIGANNDHLETSLLTGSIRLAPNPRIQVSGFAQYNSTGKRFRYNGRASWEFKPLSYVYLVFNENNSNTSPLADRTLISKVTYLRQF